MITAMAILIALFTGWRLIVSLTNYFSSLTVKGEGASVAPGDLSILIPVRDEARNLAPLFASLAMQRGDIEIIFCNDHSSDATVPLIEAQARCDSRIRLIHSPELPDGWFGKSFACYQLAAQARGRYLLFIDADVTLEPDGALKALRYAQSRRLTLLTFFPRQVMHSTGEKLTVPIMLRCLLSMLPLKTVGWKRFASLSAANGQFMLFDGDRYRRLQPHEKARRQRAEDIAIASLLKKEGYPIACLLGDGLVKCRMYDGYRAGVEGFAKNIDCFFGKSLLLTLFYGICASFAGLLFIVPAATTWPGGALLYTLLFLFLLLVINLSNLAALGIPVLRWLPVVLLQDIAFFHIFGLSVYRRFSGKGSWKGRPL
ncbi:MAG: glycosyltransferase family 2 protein [Bacteroidales bacterium]